MNKTMIETRRKKNTKRIFEIKLNMKIEKNKSKNKRKFKSQIYITQKKRNDNTDINDLIKNEHLNAFYFDSDYNFDEFDETIEINYITIYFTCRRY